MEICEICGKMYVLCPDTQHLHSGGICYECQPTGPFQYTCSTCGAQTRGNEPRTKLREQHQQVCPSRCTCEPPYTVLCTACQAYEVSRDEPWNDEAKYLGMEYCSLCGVHEDYHESERCQMYQDEREAEASIARREIAGVAEWHWWTGDAFGWISHGPDELTK